jgi:archaeal flagellin FlaB
VNKQKKKGEMAMGTLIIFIAMILIAAVAAAVLITTTSSLQTKALETGKATRQEVGTNLQIIQIYGSDASIANTISNLTVLTKLAAGSENVRFNDLLVTFGLKDSSTDYVYNGTAFCPPRDQYVVNSTQWNMTLDGQSNYAIGYSIKGSNNVQGYLTPGDVAKICYNAVRPVSESESYRVQLIPRAGTPSVISSVTPDVMNKKTEYIFP